MDNIQVKKVKTILAKDVITHCSYVGTIICLIFIYLTTVKLGTNNEAVTYISFAATLASLLLALLAIYIGLSGNASLSAVLGGAREINAQAIETQVELKITGKQNLETAQELSQQVRQLSSYVAEMQGAISQDFENLRTTISKQAEPSLSIKEGSRVNSDNEGKRISNFISWSSIYGLMISYMVIRIADTDVTYDRTRFGAIVPALGNDYALGYIVANLSAGIFQAKPDGFQDPFRFTSSQKNNVELIEIEIRSRLTKEEKANPAINRDNRKNFNKLRQILDESIGGISTAAF